MRELQKDSAHIDMEHIKPVRFAQIRIPQANDRFHTQLSDQQTIHIAEGELKEHQAFPLNVIIQVGVRATHQVLQLLHHALNARLVRRVVVLNPVQQPRDAVVRVRFDLVEERRVHLAPIQFADLICLSKPRQNASLDSDRSKKSPKRECTNR